LLSQISVFEGEELTLLDNSQEHLWKVRASVVYLHVYLL